jgi:hypothetical protein
MGVVVVVGPGYVGLSLAVEFGKKIPPLAMTCWPRKSSITVDSATRLMLTTNPSDFAGADFKPDPRDFRTGDVRHSLVDISRVRTRLSDEPARRIAKA